MCPYLNFTKREMNIYNYCGSGCSKLLTTVHAAELNTDKREQLFKI